MSHSWPCEVYISERLVLGRGCTRSCSRGSCTCTRPIRAAADEAIENPEPLPLACSTTVNRCPRRPPLIGTYSATAVKLGDVVTCLHRDRECEVTSITDVRRSPGRGSNRVSSAARIRVCGSTTNL